MDIKVIRQVTRPAKHSEAPKPSSGRIFIFRNTTLFPSLLMFPSPKRLFTSTRRKHKTKRKKKKPISGIADITKENKKKEGIFVDGKINSPGEKCKVRLDKNEDFSYLMYSGIVYFFWGG